jgi:hypothetical protein
MELSSADVPEGGVPKFGGLDMFIESEERENAGGIGPKSRLLIESQDGMSRKESLCGSTTVRGSLDCLAEEVLPAR